MLVSVREPQRQQTQSILQRVARRQRDTPQEALHSRDDVVFEVRRRQALLRHLERRDDFEVGQSPRVPCLVPSRVELRRKGVVSQDRSGLVLR